MPLSLINLGSLVTNSMYHSMAGHISASTSVGENRHHYSTGSTSKRRRGPHIGLPFLRGRIGFTKPIETRGTGVPFPLSPLSTFHPIDIPTRTYIIHYGVHHDGPALRCTLIHVNPGRDLLVDRGVGSPLFCFCPLRPRYGTRAQIRSTCLFPLTRVISELGRRTKTCTQNHRRREERFFPFITSEYGHASGGHKSPAFHALSSGLLPLTSLAARIETNLSRGDGDTTCLDMKTIGTRRIAPTLRFTDV